MVSLKPTFHQLRSLLLSFLPQNAAPAERSLISRCITPMSASVAVLCIMLSLRAPGQAAESNNQTRLPSLDTPATLLSVESPQPPASGYPAGDSYVLGAGDTLQVDVFRLPEYSGEYEVLINGALSLPMVGQVIVSGLTLEQAEQAVSEAYSQRLRRPIVNMFLVSPRPLRVGIAGEVSQP